MQVYDCLLKLLVIGDSGVGKTALIKRYTEERFVASSMPTIGVDLAVHTLQLEDGSVAKLQIWDMAGEDRFRAITNSYYRGSHAVLLAFDASRSGIGEGTLEGTLRRWRPRLERHLPPGVPVLLVATKTDRADDWTEQRAALVDEEAARRGYHFMACSALRDEGVRGVFAKAAGLVRPADASVRHYPFDEPFRLETPAPASRCCPG